MTQRAPVRRDIWLFAGTPVDGAAGTHATKALPGDTLVDTTNFIRYMNKGTQAVPAWVPDGGGAGDIVEVRNGTGGTLAAGTLVYLSGWNATAAKFQVAKADADAALQAEYVLTAAILNGADGVAKKQGQLTGQNTNGATIGDPVYLSATAGAVTLSDPGAAGALTQIVGRVETVSATIGKIQISIQGTKLIGGADLEPAISIATTGTIVLTSASAAAFAVGRLGATTPAFLVDASTATSITGIQVKSAAAGGGAAIKAIGETNVALTIDGNGSGAIGIGLTSTGAITIGAAGKFVVTQATGAIALAAGASITLATGVNFVLDGAGAGTKIGTATSQKLGFFNSTPVVQPIASVDVTGFAAGSGTASKSDSVWAGASGASAYTVGGIVTALKALGLLAA